MAGAVYHLPALSAHTYKIIILDWLDLGYYKPYISNEPLPESRQLPHYVIELCLLHHPQVIDRVRSLSHLGLELLVVGSQSNELGFVRKSLLL